MITIYKILLYSGIIIGSLIVLAIAIMAVTCLFTGTADLFVKKQAKTEPENDSRITVYVESSKEKHL